MGEKLVAAYSGHSVIISRLTSVELVSALARRQRETTISVADFQTLRGAFIQDINRQYVVINLTKSALTKARDLVAIHPLRTLDAIQLACALQARQSLANTSMIFITADQRLLTAALSEGFAVDDPARYP